MRRVQGLLYLLSFSVSMLENKNFKNKRFFCQTEHTQLAKEAVYLEREKKKCIEVGTAFIFKKVRFTSKSFKF